MPPDVGRRLAGDEAVSRLILAKPCDDAPAGVPWGVWHLWPGSLTCPDRSGGPASLRIRE